MEPLEHDFTSAVKESISGDFLAILEYEGVLGAIFEGTHTRHLKNIGGQRGRDGDWKIMGQIHLEKKSSNY